MRRNRPVEVTLVAWVALFAVAMRVVLLGLVIVLPEVREALGNIDLTGAPGAWVHFSAWVHYLVSILGIGIVVAAGIGLLRGAPWSRIALVSWGGLAILFSLMATGSFGYILWDTIVYLLMLALLYTPRAGAYFRAEDHA
ncbi:MAG: hypothetical protein M0R77_12465 [Gammaproteobacteria bacterium]|nr:hypothetical protein [Gammaproteobacteria bacterium]